MSIPTGPFFVLDHHLRNEITAHRARVFAALSRHSDPSMREIGRLLAEGTATPHQLIEDPRRADPAHRTERKQAEAALDELRRQVFGPTVLFNGPLNSQAAAGAAPTAQPDLPAAPPGTPVGTPRAAWNCHAGTSRSHEANPASRPDYADPDNGAGGVPAIRR